MSNTPTLRRRISGIALLALATTGTLTACSSGDDAGKDGGSGDAKTLVIPQQVGVPPYSYLDDKGELAGLLPDLSTALGEAMGFEVDNEQASFENGLLGLQRGTYDWVPGVDVTAERLAKFDFATNLVESYGFRVKDGGIDIGDTMEDLCGLSVAVTAGSSPVPVLQDLSKTCKGDGKDPIDVQTFADQATADLAVKSGRADTVTATSSGLAYQVTTEPGVWKITGPIYQAIDIGFAVMKGDDMAEKLVQATDDIIADGTYAEILAKYGAEKMAVEKSVLNPEPAS
ncbi:transporter substrate-binding domain-containing protein [Nocardioides nitrophenolicus]|uniref:transporter substrate-binding domain-containing protein n=1 Tax=Nocardioides nitrophenolicus TaxID=60489 RepID=UPI001956DD7F|nr:transporter substrate-binding domain-containing protein [Nocardioides nitrophenolicus]MBM7518411.1 polar amino acid transport system substrate-binding protein [Nocardioides nitrophenolicus]